MLFFTKYQCTGNDFIFLDNRTANIYLSGAVIRFLCHRRFGIGADGLVFLEKEKHSDFQIIYYNSDGKEGTLCGNASRCALAFARAIGIEKQQYVFKATDRYHKGFFKDENIYIQFGNVMTVEKYASDFVLNTGSPHYVRFVKNILEYPVFEAGKKIRHYSDFPEGINVNFVEEINDNQLYIRTYERGVEMETLSCGTGTVASVIAYLYAKKDGKYTISVRTKGGNLSVCLRKDAGAYSAIWLAGPSRKVFEGQISQSDILLP